MLSTPSSTPSIPSSTPSIPSSTPSTPTHPALDADFLNLCHLNLLVLDDSISTCELDMHLDLLDRVLNLRHLDLPDLFNLDDDLLDRVLLYLINPGLDLYDRPATSLSCSLPRPCPTSF
ncbi:hypothetical protein GSI_04560 [Ganoderma sinense ZZ0214-1]|uniref:Uncharacterized protein n=1 Tax=Ganoderma sinense ZZ0214-1 TaxID=1077348 RepID=A0A2G8SH88_9APHY|nr:hypothetical protein GSI_04560 [Ganoderma sinense ZZ0214-1]